VNKRVGGGGVDPTHVGCMWAAKYRWEEVIQFLLHQKRARHNMLETSRGLAALTWHEGVVRLLLGPLFVDPGSIRLRWVGGNSTGDE